MQITFLASSSKANCALVEADGEILVVDAGLPVRTFLRRLRQVGKTLDMVKGILVSHFHSDHAGKAGDLSKALHVPVYTTSETVEAAAATLVAKADHIEVVTPGEVQAVGKLFFAAVNTYHVPGAVGFVVANSDDWCSLGRRSVCVFNDLPDITEEIGKVISGCDMACIEADFSEAMLAACEEYKDDLKQRIRMSHMSNERLAARLKNGCDLSTVCHILLLHLSTNTNLPFIAEAKIRAVVPEAVKVKAMCDYNLPFTLDF